MLPGPDGLGKRYQGQQLQHQLEIDVLQGQRHAITAVSQCGSIDHWVPALFSDPMASCHGIRRDSSFVFEAEWTEVAFALSWARAR